MTMASPSIKPQISNNTIFILLVLALIAGLCFLMFKWKDISEYYKERDNKEKHEKLISSIKETKRFRDIDLSELNIPRITLETRWKSGFMYYKFNIINKKENDASERSLFPERQKVVRDFEMGVKSIEKINIEFLDNDDFKVFSLSIEISDMTRNLDATGNVITFCSNDNIQIKPELYKDFHDWQISYQTK